MMFGTNKMLRAVILSGKSVAFCNGVGTIVGETYKYECSTEAKAEAFAKYCKLRDPENANMPIAVGPEVAASFGAAPV